MTSQTAIPQLILTLLNPEATRHLGYCLSRLPAGSTLLLQGNLGSGKTTLAQGLGQGLGIAEPLASPTFALLHEYHDGRVPLYHFDLYRLMPEQVTALAPETYWEGLEMLPGIVLIEWCDRLPYTPAQFLTIALSPITPDSAGDPAFDPGRTATLIPANDCEIDLEAIAVAFEEGYFK